MIDYLGNAYPGFADHVRKSSFALLPTPVTQHEIEVDGKKCCIWAKRDDKSSLLYGGNKIRKLEYIFQRAHDRGAKRVATFGAVGSNHALATAIFARQFDFECTCFLARQKASPNIAKTLRMHLQLGTEIVRYGGNVDRLAVFRRHLQNRSTWVIPLGGSCWLGAVGFVNAGLELAAQITAAELEPPDSIYIANGTMGSVAGLAIGLALARLATKIHAVRVTDERFTSAATLQRLIAKTVMMMNRFDPSVPADLDAQRRVVWRDDFYAGGYAVVDTVTQRAVDVAKQQLGLTLEGTYSGKAFAALLQDVVSDTATTKLFWNTYNSRPLPLPDSPRRNARCLPEEFQHYLA